MTYKNLKNITTWARPETLEEWDKIRLQESPNTKRPITWSAWIAEKVRIALNVHQLASSEDSTDDVYQLKAILHNKQNEIERLNAEVLKLSNRAIGGSKDRILRVLQKGKPLSVEYIVQVMINTEYENVMTTLQELAGTPENPGVIVSDNTGNLWELR